MDVVPLFWLLTRRAQSRIFQRQTVKQILTKVLDDMGIREGQDLKFDIDESGTLSHPRDYCVQYRETDFNFACRLMEEEGIYYFFVHSASAHQMVISNKPNQTAVKGPSPILFDVAEGGLINISDILITIKEKVTQALNDTNSEEEYIALGSEISQLRAEIDDIVRETTFNNRSLLDGSSYSL